MSTIAYVPRSPRTQVITYQMGTGGISLCARHDDADHPSTYAVRTAPVGPVSHGQHHGECDVCEAERIARVPRKERASYSTGYTEHFLAACEEIALVQAITERAVREGQA